MPKQEIERGETLTNIQEKRTSLRKPGRDIEKSKGQQPCHSLSSQASIIANHPASGCPLVPLLSSWSTALEIKLIWAVNICVLRNHSLNPAISSLKDSHRHLCLPVM